MTPTPTAPKSDREKDKDEKNADFQEKAKRQIASNTIMVDEFDVIGEPKADPIQLTTAMLLPPAEVDESLMPDEDEGTPLISGEPVPALNTLTGTEQGRVEVLFGTRLQRDENWKGIKKTRRPEKAQLPATAPPSRTVNA